ncbi:MAG TPA: PAS domain-containing protein [Dongiaceae bacterium]
MVGVPETGIPQRIVAFRAYWESLAAGAVPERRLLDPAAIVPILPYLLLIEFEDDPFRVHYRLTGTKVDEMTGMNITGRYLDEFTQGSYQDPVLFIRDCYEKCWSTGEVVIVTYLWPEDDRNLTRSVWMGLFPFKIDGAIRQCISVEDYGPLGPKPEPIDWSRALTKE